MASLPVRDPIGDHLLTPQNAALVVTDYQPFQFSEVQSIDRDLLLENIVSTVKTAKLFGVPIVDSPAELPRDWARDETAEGVGEIVLTERLRA
jgi:nicotinamidase-related amidase